MLKTRELFAGLYALEDERVRQFLVIGEERALLFDAGFADSGVLETVRALTDLPIDVVMTHGDPDHSGGPIFMFGGHRDLDAYIASLEKLERLIPADVTVLPCHSACPIDAGFIARDLADARALRDGKLTSDPHPALPCRVYHGKATDFLF